MDIYNFFNIKITYFKLTVYNGGRIEYLCCTPEPEDSLEKEH